MNCIIVDDEPLARQGMQLLIEKMPQLTLLESFNSPIDTAPFLQQHKVDLLFLDINMPEINGFDFVKTMVQSPMVIFATAYPQYALDSYELDVIDYLLKPIRFERFMKAVNKALDYFELSNARGDEASSIESVNHDFIYIKADRRYFKIHFQDILYIEGLKDYVTIYLSGRKVITAMNLKTIFDQLPQGIFARISKSYIVNTKHIVSFDNFVVYLPNAELPIGNNFKDSFFKDFVEKKVVKR
jgi:DNA-binding LytR/AlgR family response regulator